MKRRTFLQLAMLALAGCAVPPSVTPTVDGTFKGAPTRRPTLAAIPPESCHPVAVIAPTRMPSTPERDGVDDVGLHVSNAIGAVELDPVSYRLKVTGKVDNPLVLTLDDLRCMPKVTDTVNTTCKGYFEDVTTYSGVPLLYLLQQAHLQDGIKGLNLIAAEGYENYVSLLEGLKDDNFIAYQWKEQSLPIYHGFPVRAVFPSLLGYNWTKYLVEISVE